MKEINETDFLNLAKDRFKRSVEATETAYREMLDDLQFLNGEQWESTIRTDRQADGRPCLTINKLPTFIDQIVGDQRMNRPGIKIKPVDSGGDRQTAEIIQGLIKNIEVQSDATVAYDTAFDGAVACGFGAFRILSEYIDDESFDQELRIAPIMNQFSVYYDPEAQKWNKEDGQYWILTEKMTKVAFEAKFPDADSSSFDAARDDDQWGTADTIRVAEYYYKEPSTKKLILATNPMTGAQQTFEDKSPEGWQVIRKRTVESFKIMWARITGNQILEGPTEQPGKYFPIIPVFGKNINIENQINYRGAVRNAKDPQRLYNYNRSASAELLALAPKSPYLLTPKQVQNHENEWKLSNKRNFPYLLYNSDPNAKGMPQRQPANPISSGIQQEIIVSDQELHDTTGLQRSSLGKSGNEKSGKAIVARQKEGDVGSYQFTDNLIRALTHCGRILIDLIPVFYDNARVVRIFKDDGTDRLVPINQPILEENRIYDLTTGRYDVVVTVGPSFTTQRQETASSMMEFLQYVPAAAPMVADIVAKAQDWQGAEEMEKRLKRLLPPGIVPPEEGGQAPPQQQGADPKQMAMQEMLVEVKFKQEAAKLAQEEAKVRQLDAEIKKTNAEILKIENEVTKEKRI